METNRQALDLESVEKRNKLLLNQIEFLTDELQKIKKELENEKQHHQSDSEAATSDLKHMVDESIKLKQQISTLKEDLDDVENQLISMVGNKSLRNENLLLRKDIRTLKKQNEDITNRYEMVRDEYNSAILEANSLRQDVANKKSEILVKTNELKRAWRELEQNRDDMAMMMREYAERQQENDKPSNWEELAETNSLLQDEVESLKRQNESLTTLLNELRMEISRVNEQQSIMPTLTDNQLSTMNSTSTLEANGIITSLHTPEDISAALILCMNSLSVIINDFGSSDNQELIRRVSTLHMFKKQIMLINDEAQVLVNKDDQHRKVLIEQDAKLNDYEQTISNLQEENEKLTNQVSTQATELESCHHNLTSKLNELEIIKSKMESSERQAFAKETEIANQRIEELCESYNKKLEDQEEIKKNLNKEKEELEDHIKELEKTIKKNQTVIQETEEKLVKQEKLTETKQTMVDEYSNQIQELNSIINELQELQLTESTHASQALDLQAELTTKDNQIKELENLIDQASITLDQEKQVNSQLTSDLKRITEGRDRLQQTLQSIENDNKELTEELQKQTTTVEHLQAKEAENAKLLKERDSYLSQCLALQQQVNQLNQLQSQLTVEVPQCQEVEVTNRDEVIEYAQEMAVDPEASQTVVDFNCSNCELDNDDIAIIATIFETGGFKNLRTLNLSNNSITLRGCTTLFQAIAERDSEMNAYNSWNESGITEAESCPNMLQKLLIGNNRIRTKGFIFLLNLIKNKKYPELWELDVSSNELEDSCINEMKTVLKSEPHVSSIHIVHFEGNGYSQATIDDFNRILISSYQ